MARYAISATKLEFYLLFSKYFHLKIIIFSHLFFYFSFIITYFATDKGIYLDIYP